MEFKIDKLPQDFNTSIQFMERRVHSIIEQTEGELAWILNSPAISTCGAHENKNDLLDNTKFPIFKTNRGGKYTYHGPGQKVIYFVLDLNKRGKNIRKLINNIENCIIEVLNEYNIKSYPDRKNIGIWVDDKNKSKKIAAIGIKVKKWVAYHGFSLNISNDLNKYNYIIPCGIKDREVTSLKVLGIKNYSDIEKIIIKKFLNIFH